jgi:hypothetical protein
MPMFEKENQNVSIKKQNMIIVMGIVINRKGNIEQILNNI